MAGETSDAKITEIADKVKSPAAEKPTAEEVAVVEEKQEEVTTEAKKDLAQLKQEFQAKQKSERINMKQHTEALKKTEYQKQVGYILGIESTNPVVLKQGIKDLQKALGFKGKAADGALGPKTFDALKVKWEKRDPPNQDYNAFINELMGRKTEAPTAPVITGISTINLDSSIESIQSIESIKPKLEINTKELQHDMENGMLRVGDEKINFELKGSIKTAFIDRDAYKIMDADDKDSYELNIRSMEDNVIIKKEDISYALAHSLTTITGLTKPKKEGELPKTVTLIINKEPIKQENKPDTVSSDATNSSKGLNIQTGDALKNADSENKDQTLSSALNIQMDSVTRPIPEMKSDIVTSIEENMSNKTVDSAIPEPDTIVA